MLVVSPSVDDDVCTDSPRPPRGRSSRTTGAPRRDAPRVTSRAESRGPALVCGRRTPFPFELPIVCNELTDNCGTGNAPSVGLGGGDGNRDVSRARARSIASVYFAIASRR